MALNVQIYYNTDSQILKLTLPQGLQKDMETVVSKYSTWIVVHQTQMLGLNMNCGHTEALRELSVSCCVNQSEGIYPIFILH